MLVEKDLRAAWGWMHLEQLTSDVRYGLRQVRRNPAFSAIAIATLALGIGANSAMFSAVDAVLIRPLPYLDAARLVMIWDEMSHIGFPKHQSTPAEWHEWRSNNTVFTDIAATQPVQATLSSEGAPEQVPARKVTANLWTVLGARPLLGRAFTEDEDLRGVRVAVISHGLWQRRFGAARDVLGRKITLNDSPYEVIGVMPPEFYFLPGRDIDIWIPTSFSAGLLRHFSWHDVHCVARLRPGVTLHRAREEMAALSLRVSAPHVDRPRAAVVVPLREELAGKTQTSLIVLLCASGAVLLIACVNLANLLMARGAARRREAAVRAALGAGRGRLIAQFLTESLVLAGFGAVAGLALALPVMRFLETLAPETMPPMRLTLDRRVAFVNAELESVRAIPGVMSAGAISRIPLTETAQTTRYAFPGQPAHDTRAQDALSRVVTRDYFSTAGARLREGRFFDISDRLSESPAAIVNESFADRNFPGRSSLGARFKFGHLGEKGYLYTIVGVVKEIRDRGVAEELKPTIYRLHEQAVQTGDAPSGIVVRTSVEPLSIVAAVRQAIWSVDPNQPITRVQTLEDIVARQLSAPSQNTALLSAFALLALLLASLGLYGVLSYAVTQRTNEIGVRMALGATSANILLSFGRRGLALTLAGLGAGLVLAMAATSLMTTLLYGFRPDYAAVVLAVSGVLLIVALAACLVPARRASRVDPMVALRHE